VRLVAAYNGFSAFVTKRQVSLAKKFVNIHIGEFEIDSKKHEAYQSGTLFRFICTIVSYNQYLIVAELTL